MATYNTVYFDRLGRRRKERMDAVDPSMVRNTLSTRGCFISSIELHTARRYRHDKLRVPRQQLLMALQAIKLLIKAGAKIDRAMRVAVEQSPPGKLRYVLTTIAEGTEGGDFAAAFEQFPNVFPETVVELLKASQIVGDLENGLGQVCIYYTRIEQIRRNVLKGLFLPVIGSVALCAAITVIFGFTIPQYKKVFLEMMTVSDLPWITRFFFNISDILVGHPTFIILMLVSAVVVMKQLLKMKRVQAVLTHFAKKIPLIGSAMMATALAKLSITYADLTKAGFKTIEVLQIVSRVVGDIEVRNAIIRIRETILNNSAVGASFAKEKAVFPPEFLTAVAIGENDLFTIFETLGKHYELESTNKIDIAVSALEPAMAALLGGFALLSGLAIVLPSVFLIMKLSGGSH
jgi:type II secretory pathway component PulF